jgi:hypothetical protein
MAHLYIGLFGKSCFNIICSVVASVFAEFFAKILKAGILKKDKDNTIHLVFCQPPLGVS